MPAKYGVWCHVWGGVTGDRQCWLHHDNVRTEFPTMAAAQAEADRLNIRMNHAHSVAFFKYTAQEITES